MSTHMLTLPANKFICETKELDNVTHFLPEHVDVTTPLQVTSRREPDSIIASLHGTEKESNGQNMPEYPPYHQNTTNSQNSGLDELCHSGADFSSPLTTISGKDKNCLRHDSENLLHNSISFSNNPCVFKILENSLARYPVLTHEQLLVPDPQEFPSLFTPEESFIVQNELMQLEDATQITFQGSSGLPELPNRTPEDATTARSDDGMNMKECDANTSLLESMTLDLSTNSFVQDWSGDSVLQAGSLSNLGDIHSESVSEQANKHSLSTGDSGFPALTVIEQLLGGGVHKPAGHIPPVTRTYSALAGGVSDQLPRLAFREGLTAYTTQPNLKIQNILSYKNHRSLKGGVID
jgi:hypothetical protein